MANANLFQAYLQQPKSVLDYQAEMDNADLRREQLANTRQQNALQAMAMQDTLAQRRIAAEDRNVLQRIAAGWTADTTPEQRAAALRNSGRAGLMSQADAIEKSGIERTKATAEASKAQSQVLDETIKRYRGMLDFITTPEGAARWMAAQYADPVLGQRMAQTLGPLEQQIAELQAIRDPKSFAQWRQQSALGMEKFLEFNQKARNDLILPDGSVNQPLLTAKTTVAKAGASNVNVNTKQEGEEAKAVGKFLGEQYADIQKAGIQAQAKLDRAARMEQLLSRINTGKLEGVKKDAAALAQGLGITIDPNLGDKEAFEALSNQLALEARNPSGGAGMPGAMSDKDREFLQQITPNLTKTPEGNRVIIDTAKKLARREVEVAKLAREYRARRGTLDEGFFEVLRQHSDANPLFPSTTAPAPAAGNADLLKQADAIVGGGR